MPRKKSHKSRLYQQVGRLIFSNTRGTQKQRVPAPSPQQESVSSRLTVGAYEQHLRHGSSARSTQEELPYHAAM